MLCAPPYAPYAPYVPCLLSRSSVSNVETAARDLESMLRVLHPSNSEWAGAEIRLCRVGFIWAHAEGRCRRSWPDRMKTSQLHRRGNGWRNPSIWLRSGAMLGKAAKTHHAVRTLVV